MVGERFEDSLELYFQQCSVLVTGRDLAMMAATLANGGVNPSTGKRAVPAEYIKDILSIMLSCGMYDYAGEWAFRVGLPAKSGVSGGVIAVVPGRLGIGVFSPRLDPKGNSVRGVAVCQELSRRFGLHAFEAAPPGDSLDDQLRLRSARSVATS
jgi:glutaminase